MIRSDWRNSKHGLLRRGVFRNTGWFLAMSLRCTELDAKAKEGVQGTFPLRAGVLRSCIIFPPSRPGMATQSSACMAATCVSGRSFGHDGKQASSRSLGRMQRAACAALHLCFSASQQCEIPEPVRTGKTSWNCTVVA